MITEPATAAVLESRNQWREFSPALAGSASGILLEKSATGRRNDKAGSTPERSMSRRETPDPTQKKKPILQSPVEVTNNSSNRQHFQFDVFLCFGKADEEIVSDVAERLANDGLDVFKNDKQKNTKVEDFKYTDYGLMNSHVVVLFASKRVTTSSSVWNQLVFQAQRYHDPWNPERCLL